MATNKGQISPNATLNPTAPAPAPVPKAADAPKSDRKKLVSTQLLANKILVWHKEADKSELFRLDLAGLVPTVIDALVHYGAKQIVADIGASLEGQARLDAMGKAVASLGAGAWPRRESQPAVVTLDTALDVTWKAMQRTNPAITLAEVKRLLGLPA